MGWFATECTAVVPSVRRGCAPERSASDSGPGGAAAEGRANPSGPVRCGSCRSPLAGDRRPGARLDHLRQTGQEPCLCVFCGSRFPSAMSTPGPAWPKGHGHEVDERSRKPRNPVRPAERPPTEKQAVPAAGGPSAARPGEAAKSRSAGGAASYRKTTITRCRRALCGPTGRSRQIPFGRRSGLLQKTRHYPL
jgi:hypothetical protein